MQWEGILSWTITRRQVSRDLWLLRPSPVIAHWVSYQQKPSSGNLLQGWCWGWAFPATRDKVVMKRPQSMVRFMTTRGPCQLQIGTYQEHCQWLSKAFAICLYRDWTPCCHSCWSSATPEGVQGGVRHSVLQGIWWDKSLDSWIFLGTDFMISILASPHI